MHHPYDKVVLTLHPGAARGHHEVRAELDGKMIGYATFKPGRNDYVRGFRIGNYTVFPPHRRNGLGSAMVAFFEKETGRTVIPSQLFGAAGKLTGPGLDAAVARLRRTRPSWLPDRWEGMIESPKL